MAETQTDIVLNIKLKILYTMRHLVEIVLLKIMVSDACCKNLLKKLACHSTKWRISANENLDKTFQPNPH